MMLSFMLFSTCGVQATAMGARTGSASGPAHRLNPAAEYRVPHTFSYTKYALAVSLSVRKRIISQAFSS